MPRELKIENPKMRAFFEKAVAHIQQTKTPCAIPSGQPEFVAWCAYFEKHVGALPVALQMAISDPTRSITVPTQWPEWFDTQAALSAPQQQFVTMSQPQREAAE